MGQITVWPGSREETPGTQISVESKSLGGSWKTCLDAGLRMSWEEAAFPEDERSTRLARGDLAESKVWDAVNHPSATCMVSFGNDRPEHMLSILPEKTHHSPRASPSVMTALRKWVRSESLCSLYSHGGHSVFDKQGVLILWPQIKFEVHCQLLQRSPRAERRKERLYSLRLQSNIFRTVGRYLLSKVKCLEKKISLGLIPGLTNFLLFRGAEFCVIPK